jgi:two-component system, cell cycle response regulator
MAAFASAQSPLPGAPAGDAPTAHHTLETWKSPPVTLPAAPCRAACLVHVYPLGPRLGARYPLGETTAVIGRGDDCEIQIRDASISRYHARIAPTPDGRYVVNDLESTNGTFVNNAAPGGRVLRDGDHIRFGNCIYRFLASEDLEAGYPEELYRLAIIDGLTQLHNRRYLTEFLDRELARARRYRRPLAVVLVDVDCFRAVNDGFGQLAGDMALMDLCGRLRATVRRDELLARFGEDRFALVLPETDGCAAEAAAERSRLVVERHPFRFNGHSYPLTISVGVTFVAGGEPMKSDALIARAETNLFRAKQAGRNRVVVS